MGQQHERLKHHGNDGVLPSQFIFVWVHVTEEEKTGDISFNKNFRQHSNNETRFKACEGSLGSVVLFFSLFNISWCNINCGSLIFQIFLKLNFLLLNLLTLGHV